MNLTAGATRAFFESKGKTYNVIGEWKFTIDPINTYVFTESYDGLGVNTL